MEVEPLEKQGTQPFRVGVHTSIAGGISRSVERAVSLRCSTMQIFSHNPRQWHKSPISTDEAERFAKLRERHDIRPVFVHASYLINLISHSESVTEQSIDLLSYELMNADILGAEYVVLHTGSARGKDEYKARRSAARAINRALRRDRYRASLILENTAGERGDITSSIKDLARIIDESGSDRIAGICLDTCHAFSAGYDLTSSSGLEHILTEIKAHIGLGGLKLIHLNDSKRPLGSGVDRHEHIGKGHIGTGGFENILSENRISRVPIILETPKKNDNDDKRNLKRVFDILSSIK
jgi:deoxyribonuclease-4